MINEIINIDAVEGLKKLDDESIDMVLTSPPYDNLRTYENKCVWNFEKFKQIANELKRVLKDGGVIVWNVNDSVIDGSETLTSFKQALYFHENLNLKHFDTMIFSKPALGARGDNRGYWQTFEYMFIISKGRPKTINLIKDHKNKESRDCDSSRVRLKTGELVDKKRTGYGEFGRRTNVWSYLVGKNLGTKDDVSWHPATFPEQLAKDHIYSWTNENDTVLDPFSGSGTTAIAAYLMKRNFIGFEINENYFKQSKKRLEERTAQLSLF
jgi:site-specific DNA-methyltransferase (adenine-specific)